MTQEIIQKIFSVKSSTVDDMKKLLNEIKTQKNQTLSQRVQQLEQELKEIQKAKKYWLVWEEKKEHFDKETIWKLPVLEEMKEKNIKTPPAHTSLPPQLRGTEGEFLPTNILIEWDNYHTLSVLNYTHAWKIDVIYIDPPYNTWNNDFVYNDKIVDKEDKFRHSKWLSFMNKRLKLAKNLLSESWVIFISIDDNELFQLKLLCDEIFWSENFVDSIVWDKKSSAKWVPPKNMLVNVHEYIIVYQKWDWFKFKGIERTEEWGNFKNPDNDPRWPWRESNIKSTIKPIEESFTIKNPDNWKEYTNTWAFSKETIELMIQENRILWKESLPKQKEFMLEMKNENMAIKSNWWLFDPQSTTMFLKNLLPDIKFDNPKPLKLMNFLLEVSTNKNSTILDFFAWSWTTWHAVLELNKKDSGNRKFILATNNENQICENVTYERLKRVMTWYKNQKWENVEWLGWNLVYLKTDFIDKQKWNDDLRWKMVDRCSELLCLKENIWDEIKQKNEKIKIFKRDDKYLAILYDMFYFDEFKELLKTLDKKVSVYAFSHYKLSKTDFDNMQNIEIEQIPDPILEVYENIFWL